MKELWSIFTDNMNKCIVTSAQIGTREDWYNEFGRFYDDRTNENVWLNGKFEWRL